MKCCGRKATHVISRHYWCRPAYREPEFSNQKKALPRTEYMHLSNGEVQLSKFDFPKHQRVNNLVEEKSLPQCLTNEEDLGCFQDILHNKIHQIPRHVDCTYTSHQEHGCFSAIS
ncbi:uncharacterized protein LOC144581569 [Callithrix jacchus]